MSKKPKIPVDSAYLARMGTIAARDGAPLVRQRSQEQGIALPLHDKQLSLVLDWTIAELVRMKKISWRRSLPDARAAFITAWTDEMDRQGIRS
jgi:hypothetical protein